MFSKEIEFKPFFIKCVMFATIIYLILPQILWVALSLKIVLAIVVVIGIVFTLFFAWKCIPLPKHGIKIPLYVLVVSEIIICVILIASGMGAVIGEQRSDYNRSNAIISDLVNNKWPVLYNEDGNVSALTYYIAYFVPPAIVGKVFSHSVRVAEIACLLWTVIGFSIAILDIYIVTKKTKLRTMWMILCWGGLDCIGYVIVNGSLFYGTEHLEHWATLTPSIANSHIANYMSTACDINWNPHSFLPVLLLVPFIMFMVHNDSFKLCVLSTSTLLFWSPLVAVGIIPVAVAFLIYKKCRIKEFVSIPDILSCVFVIPLMVLYFLSMNLSGAGGTSSGIRGIDWIIHNWTILILFIVLEYGIIGFIIFKSINKERKIDRILCICMLVFMTVCLLFDYGECHDFSMRATVIPWIVLCMIAIKNIDNATRIYKNAMLIYLCFSTVTCATEYGMMLEGVHNYGFDAKRVYNEGNTISGWGLEGQYVGNPSSFFFNTLSNAEYDEEEYVEYIKKVADQNQQYIIYDDNSWALYYYQGYLYALEKNSEKTAEVEIEFKSNGTPIKSESYSANNNGYKFGSLCNRDGVFRVSVGVVSCDSVSISLSDSLEKVELNFTQSELQKDAVG